MADTRISNSGQSGGLTISTDNGSKLFALPIVCRTLPSSTDLEQRINHVQSIGFAFAGDVSPATMTFSTAATLLQHLSTPVFVSPPSLRDIADLVRKIASTFSGQWLSSTMNHYGRFEAAIFGYCSQLNQYVAYHLSSKPTFDSPICITRHLFEDECDILVLGSGKQQLICEIERIKRNGDEYGRTGRVPKLAIEAMVKHDSCSGVGGSLSIGLASRLDYNLYSWVRPVEYGKPEAVMSYNGFDLTAVSEVGDFFIGINGMV